MIIKSIRVQNFRCIKDETLYCENLTVLVGPNGSGKSSFLRALQMFYDPNARYTEDDFYARDTSQSIKITVTFTSLNEEEMKFFKKYVKAGELTVEKEMTWPPSRGSQKYYGICLRNPDFDAFRSAKGSELRKEYNSLRAKRKYSSLPEYTNRFDAEKALTEWEYSHPDECEWRRDEGQFFGFKEVGGAHLERFTKFIFVPAVRDASEDAIEGRGAVITEIMDLVVRRTLVERDEIVKFEEEINKKYREIFDPKKIKELQTLEGELSKLLQTYAPDTSVKLNWIEKAGITVEMPEADIRLVEDEYHSPVSHTGHGVQRAFILAMLQYLAMAETIAKHKDEEAQNYVPKMPNLILGIEEPELYQHPDRQRHLANTLAKLAKDDIPGVINQIQVIYSTHSPLFVDLERFEQIRIFRKVKKEKEAPKQTKIFFATLEKVAELLEKADNRPKGSYSAEILRTRLSALINPWINEGFFAKLAVLVEGIVDRAAILGSAWAMGYDLESKGIAVIPCNGKTCLDRPIAIFKTLEIPVYAIWDSDQGSSKARPEDNHRLLRLFNQTAEDWPEMVTDEFACFKQNLLHKVKAELGKEFFNKSVKECCEQMKIGYGKHALENPKVFHYVFKKAKEQGKGSLTLETIIKKIISRLP